MNKEVIISGVHVELTEALKNLVNSKIQKLFNHDEKIIRVRVELSVSKNKAHQDEFIAKGKVEIAGPDIIATAASDDLYKSIDLLTIKLDRQLIDANKRANENFLNRKSEVMPTTEV